MRKTSSLLALAFISLAGCTAADQPASPQDGGQVAQAREPVATPSPSATPPAPVNVPTNKAQPGDLASCPGINPDIRRSAGSNCYGITPDQCGADRVRYLVGQEGTEERERYISGFAKGGFRWIPYMTAVTEDLRADRLNVELDKAGVITNIDCY